MTQPALNTKLFARIYEQISKHPETHNQDDFECGTTRCIAGWALFFAYGADWRDAPRVLKGGSEVAAMELLGLAPREAGTLFYNFDNEDAMKITYQASQGVRPKGW